jgi:hypothetical protein
MRVEKLTEAEAAGLRALGFNVDADGETAALKAESNDITITIMRPLGAMSSKCSSTSQTAARCFAMQSAGRSRTLPSKRTTRNDLRLRGFA